MKFPHITEIADDVVAARNTLEKLEQRLQRLKDEMVRVRENLSMARQQDARETARERLLSDPESAFEPGELHLHDRHEELERERLLVEDATAAQRQRVKDAEREAGARLAADHRDAYRALIQRLCHSAVETALLAAEEQRFREDLKAAGGVPYGLGVANSERLTQRLRSGQSPLWYFLRDAIEAGHLSRKDCIALDKLIDAAGESPHTIGRKSTAITGALVRYLDQQNKQAA